MRINKIDEYNELKMSIHRVMYCEISNVYIFLPYQVPFGKNDWTFSYHI